MEVSMRLFYYEGNEISHKTFYGGDRFVYM